MTMTHFQCTDAADKQVKGLLNRNPFFVEAFKLGNPKGKRILFILDSIPREDLRSKLLYSGDTGKMFTTMLSQVQQSVPEDIYAIGIAYNICKTYDLPKADQDRAYDLFNQRIHRLILKVKPDLIITCGLHPAYSLQGTDPNRIRNSLGYPYVFETQGKKFQAVSTLSVTTLYGDPDAKFTDTCKNSQLAGMWVRHVTHAINGTTPTIKLKRGDYKCVVVDTLRKVKALLSMLKKEDYISIDTEGSGLERRTAIMHSVQFSLNSKRKVAYFLPLTHKSSPFSATQLAKVKKALCRFFETSNAKYHIYHNAKFDVGQFLSLGVRYYKAPVYCTMAGEYALDENRVALKSFGYPAYALKTICGHYGNHLYDELPFGKEDRIKITETEFNADLIEYACVDVIILWQLHDLQLMQGTEDHVTVVTEVIGSLIHSFATMEYFGLPVDKAWVHELKGQSSTINKLIHDMKDEFRKSPHVKDANTKLLAKSGAPMSGLFGSKESWIFDIGKDLHKQTLYFDVMNIEPLGRNAKGGGKLDKAFKEHYEDVPEVKWLSDLGKAEKLRSSYVNKFYDVLRLDPDAKLDCRIRPAFSFASVVTGRASAKDPSLHQIPSRSEMGKLIKRMFVAELGNIFIAADYSAHEIRGFTLIAKDKVFADQFAKGLFARLRYRLDPEPTTLREVELYGDVHKLNVQFFHGIHPDDCSKEDRNAIKGTTFGTLYGMGVKTLSETVGQTMDATKALLKKFFAKFFASKDWLDNTKAFAEKHFYVRSPLGRVRHLFGFMHPSYGIKAACARMAANSPIQGTASDQGFIGGRAFQGMLFDWTIGGVDLKTQISNSVHDSVYAQCPFWALPFVAYIMEHSYTTKVHQKCRDTFSAELPVGLELDFEFGDNLRDVRGWDFQPLTVVTHAKTTLAEQEERFGVTCTNRDELLAAVVSNAKLMGVVRNREVKALLERGESVNYEHYSKTLLRKVIARASIVEAQFEEQE